MDVDNNKSVVALETFFFFSLTFLPSICSLIFDRL